MKRIKAVLMMLAGLAVLCLVIAIGYTGVTSEVKAAPPEDEPQPTIDLGGLGPIAVGTPNDRCADAEKISPLIMMAPPHFGARGGKSAGGSFTARANDRTFHNGHNVDDWYVYTTHDLDCPQYYRLSVEVVSDKPQIEVELYEYCHAWPIVSSMYQETFVWGEDDTEIHILSGLSKTISILDAQPNFDYYIHVNVLSAPDDGGTITYDLTVREYCEQLI